MRRIGVLMNRVADDPEAQARLKALVQGLQQLGWVEGRNVRMDVRWTAGIADHVYRHAAQDEKRDRTSVGERLAMAKHLVVLGDPGAGKTTLTRWIATAYLLRLKSETEWKDLPDIQTLPAEEWLPILVRCRDLDADCLDGALDDVLKHTLRKAELSKT